jgi:hypothetical protein
MQMECDSELKTLEKVNERSSLLEDDMIELTATVQEFATKADATCHIRNLQQRE